MSYTDNINGIPAQDTVLRQGIATLRNTVISNTIKPLTVDHNGVYTANPNNGTYGYSPVTVDTGVYTGATAPDDSLGKDGDHYYQISKTRYGIKSVNSDYLTSSPMRILANEFYVTSPFKLTGIRINLIAAVNVKYYVLDNTKTVIYESDSIQGAVGWNEHTLTTPITLVANQNYIIAANVQDKGTYTQNNYTTWNTEYVIFVRDLYSASDNIGGLVNDSVTCMVDPVLETDVEYVIAEYMKDNDTWVSISGSPKMILSTLNATDNGTYNAPTGTAYSSVSVNVGPEIISRSDWNALTTAQKQAKGLVVIQDVSTGFKRGEYINGADYVPTGYYIPYSDESDVICEAYYDNYDVTSTRWGNGSTPMVFTANPTTDSQEESIYLQGKSGIWGSIDTGAVNSTFTAYCVAKVISGDRLMCAVAARTSGNAVLFNSPSSVRANIWVTEHDTGVNALTDYVACAMNSSGQFVIYKPSVSDAYTVKLNPSSTGRYVVFGRSDLDAASQFAEPTDVKVRYAAVCDVVESVETMTDNVKSLFAQFVAPSNS